MNFYKYKEKDRFIMQKMKILLVEDDRDHCNEYRRFVEQENIHSIVIADGCHAAIELIKNRDFDVILLDLELNNSDGDGIALLKNLKMLELKKSPYIIVITVNISEQTHVFARKNGADFIFIKLKIDYSPQLVVNFAYNYFLNCDNEITRTNPVLSEEFIKQNIAKEMEHIGITYELDGRDYLVDSIYMAIKQGTRDLNLTKDIYPVLAKKYRKSDQSIEKAIRNAINKAWRETDIMELAKHYTVELSYASAVPKNKELICYYAEKIKA